MEGREKLLECLQQLSDSSGFKNFKEFKDYRESLTEDKCFKGYKINYPIDTKEYLAKDGKFYSPGMKVMLAETLYKKGELIKLTDKLSKSLNIDAPPIGWWASEKWDGIRAIWDGYNLVSRGSQAGNPKIYTYVPKWFSDAMPPGIALDGEIWIGRGLFQQTSKLSNIKPGKTYSEKQIDTMWRGTKKNPPVTFKAFDMPGLKIPFEQRMNRLKMIISDREKCWSEKYPEIEIFPIQYTNQVLINSMETLIEMYTKITNAGAEGLMIRAPGSPYEEKRSKYLLKYKVQEDSECIVRRYVPGDGRLKGLLGSLDCELIKDGKFTGVFTHVGTGLTDVQRKEYSDSKSEYYIPIGAIVSFSYMEMTKDGIPRHPVYRGVRHDFKVPKEKKKIIIIDDEE
jgi:DNA ligase 1